MTDKERIREVIEKRYEYWKEKEFTSHSIESEIRMSECQHLLLMIKSLQEEPVSEELEEAAEKAAINAFFVSPQWTAVGKELFKDGAQWQEKKDQSTIELAEDHAMLAGIEKGYHQAEKDLELTWEDIRELYIIFAEVDTEIELCKTDIAAETLGYYQEVLKRFKEMKEK